MTKLTDYELKSLYESNVRINKIAEFAGMTRQGVWKRLKRLGLHVDRHGTVTVNCAFCGNEIKRFRTRASKLYANYCNPECYYASRENPNYIPWRQGQRLARAIVAQHIRLTYEMIVHHKDTNNKNNDLSNLMVFANQADHMKFHHSKSQVKPIWDGACIKTDKSIYSNGIGLIK